ncbi:alkaline phosphatase family protein [Nocardia sp. NPDC004860]|uniref:alkaline phosphatase family protein n=1 Tax=Nocardia sp. NPDC004860 TaxID=3154557 RepID=UPI0033A6C1F9
MRRFGQFIVVLVFTIAALAVGYGPHATADPGAPHIFVIQLENKGYDETWGPASAAPYLSKTLRSEGVLLSQYYGTGHNSLDNYIAQLSGQGPNAETQADCQIYSDFVGAGTVPPGQAVGQGCVYPASVQTLAGQLTGVGRSWKGYMEDMGTPCRHPALNSQDTTQKATVAGQYAARHNPFVYFHEIIDSPACRQQVVDLGALKSDLAQPDTTPNFAYITPDLCDDGHDSPCVTGAPGGLASADLWLRQWVPVITSAPAFQQNGILIITFDESDGPQQDSSACCGEGPGPNSPLPGIVGPGGGRVGALVISPKSVTPGTFSDTPYNHYSLLASIEDRFGLPYLGFAASPGLPRFGTDVFNKRN